MRPDISKLISPLYPKLVNHPYVSTYPDVLGVAENLYFVSHTIEEERVISFWIKVHVIVFNQIFYRMAKRIVNRMPTKHCFWLVCVSIYCCKVTSPSKSQFSLLIVDKYVTLFYYFCCCSIKLIGMVGSCVE